MHVVNTDFKRQFAANVVNLPYTVRDVNFYGISVKEYLFQDWQDGLGKLIWDLDVVRDGETRKWFVYQDLNKLEMDHWDNLGWFYRVMRSRIVGTVAVYHPEIYPNPGDDVAVGSHVTYNGEVIGRVSHVGPPTEAWPKGLLLVDLTRDYRLGIDPAPPNEYTLRLLNPLRYEQEEMESSERTNTMG